VADAPQVYKRSHFAGAAPSADRAPWEAGSTVAIVGRLLHDPCQFGSAHLLGGLLAAGVSDHPYGLAGVEIAGDVEAHWRRCGCALVKGRRQRGRAEPLRCAT